MESTLKNMVLSLLAITFVSALALASVHELTREKIESSKGGKVVATIGEVLPEYDNNPATDTTHYNIDGLDIVLYRGESGGEISGYAVKSSTVMGYSGLIELMVGFKPNGEIVNIAVLQHSETPGLGSKIEEEDNPLLVSFVGKSPAELKMSVKKDGGDIDVITASTVTSRAYTDAVERAYKAFVAKTTGEAIVVDESDPMQRLLPGYTNSPRGEKMSVSVEGKEHAIYVGRAEGELIGYAVEGSSDKSYNEDGVPIELLVGFDAEGVVTAIVVTHHEETPGFGSAIADEENLVELCFVGKRIGEMNLALKPDGGDVDVMSAATVTTAAYVDAVRDAYEAYVAFMKREN